MPINYSEFNQLWSQVYRLTCAQEEMQTEIKRLKTENYRLKYDNDLQMKEMGISGRIVRVLLLFPMFTIFRLNFTI